MIRQHSRKDFERDKRCQNENRQILYEITVPKQKRPNNLHDILHNDHFRKDPVKFIIYSASVEEKNVIILRNKELSVNFEEVCFSFMYIRGKNKRKLKQKCFFVLEI